MKIYHPVISELTPTCNGCEVGFIHQVSFRRCRIREVETLAQVTQLYHGEDSPGAGGAARYHLLPPCCPACT